MSFFDTIKKIGRWEQGRQGSGYDKMLLLTGYFPIPFDIYLIKYPKGAFIPAHIDPVSDKKHFRLNMVLKKAKKGGEFICKDPIYNSSRIKLFRPDISEHSVTLVEEGNRYLLSIGWTRPNL